MKVPKILTLFHSRNKGRREEPRHPFLFFTYTGLSYFVFIFFLQLVFVCYSVQFREPCLCEVRTDVFGSHFKWNWFSFSEVTI